MEMQVMKPLTKQAPWLAAWNRTVRKMVRLKMKDSESRDDSKGDTPLSELFFQLTQQAPLMNRNVFETWLSQSGYTTSTASWLLKQMSELAKARSQCNLCARLHTASHCSWALRAC
jgi:hypothetical protein